MGRHDQTWICRIRQQRISLLVEVCRPAGALSDSLRVVGVLCDHELDAAAEWLQESSFDWPQFVDRTLTPENKCDHPIARRYAVGAFPTLWIIDRKGILREQVDREHLEETILRYLDEED